MKVGKRFGFLHFGIVVTVFLSGILGYNLFLGDRQLFLPGDTTHGHHQIELQCSACHVESFKSGDPMQQACVDCHAEELDRARDTHPKKKFTDPRNANLLASLDATQCVTCHVEHSPEITGQFGVTMPEDFCYFCHQKIAEERPSHQNFEFDSCSDAGCHNYHDNKALYEKFLAKHIDEPALLEKTKTYIPNAVALWRKKNSSVVPLAAHHQDGDDIDGFNATIVNEWASSTHAKVAVNCSGCHDEHNWRPLTQVLPHDSKTEDFPTRGNPDQPAAMQLSFNACMDCHQQQTRSFSQGLHGMRLQVGLSPLKVRDARLPMHKDAGHRELNCVSCHDPHQPDLKAAAVDACLGCHKDEHSDRYKASAHFELWQQEIGGSAKPGSGVSCATCHMPRIKKGKKITVEHNQSATLEPNSKMIRPVCLNCHGLEFTLASLKDQHLIDSNFSEMNEYEAKLSHQSFDLVRRRIAEKEARRRKRSD